MDKFLLAEHPMRTDHGVFILVNVAPEMLIKCTCLNEDEGVGNLDDYFGLFTHKNSNGTAEQWELCVVKFYNLSYGEAEEITPKIRKRITEAWHWYKAYLEWEDGNIDTDEFSKLN